jgi:hypothetical protein
MDFSGGQGIFIVLLNPKWLLGYIMKDIEEVLN